MRNINIAFGLVMGVIILFGCTTTTETDPAKVSMGDLLFGKKRLDSHLADRRASLDRLMDKSATLSLRLNDQERNLRKLDSEFKREDQELQEVETKQQELRNKAKVHQHELDGVQRQLKTLNDELNKLQQQLQNTSAEKDELTQKIAEHEAEISSLESEVAIIERAIDRILTARARHALETN